MASGKETNKQTSLPTINNFSGGYIYIYVSFREGNWKTLAASPLANPTHLHLKDHPFKAPEADAHEDPPKVEKVRDCKRWCHVGQEKKGGKLIGGSTYFR